MAQDKVQLKREQIVGNDTILEDINPNTNTNSIIDSMKGVPLDQTLAMIVNMINNKLARYVNSVNGRTGVVIIDANDVGLGNVDNVSFGDIKRWVINYLEEVFGNKRLIVKEWLSDIDVIVGENDKTNADRPFYAEKGNAATSDYMGYIGYIWWDESENTLRKTVVEIRNVGFTDKSLIYNVNANSDDNPNYRNFGFGGLGVNIWSGEDALRIRNNIAKNTPTHSDYSPEDLNDSGLYIEKSVIIPEVYFFDGIYGNIVTSGTSMHNTDALIYWTTDPTDTEAETLPIVQIRIDGVQIGDQASGGSAPNTLHTPLTLKVGDLILSNFVSEPYEDSESLYHAKYPGILDSLTSRQPALGRVIQAYNADTNTPCIIDFKPNKPNTRHGIKLVSTGSSLIYPSDNAIGLDELRGIPRMNDGTSIYAYETNISGLNALDKPAPSVPNYEKKLYTIYPTGKSSNVLETHNADVVSESAFILPNFSLCVIPGYEFVEHGGQPSESLAVPIVNWDPSSPFKGDEGHIFLNHRSWNMLGINLEKFIYSGQTPEDPEPVQPARYAKNISGLRIGYDNDELLESWFGYGSDSEISGMTYHSGGLSVNVGDFLGIGTIEEIESISHRPINSYYEGGKVNVRINREKGLYNAGENRLGINIATGVVYNNEGETSVTWKEGGLHFINAGELNPGHKLISVNTGRNASGLGITNSYPSSIDYLDYGRSKSAEFDDNVLAVQINEFRSTYFSDDEKSALEISYQIISEDIAKLIPMNNIYQDKIWKSYNDMIHEYDLNPGIFVPDVIYVAGNEYYVFNTYDNEDIFRPYFVFYTVQEQYDDILYCIRTGTIMPEIAEEVASTIGFLRSQCHVLILPDANNSDKFIVTANIWQNAVINDDLRYPDLDGNGIIDSTESTTILDLYFKYLTSTSIYSNPSHTEFYTDPELLNPLVPVIGQNYVDVSDNTMPGDIPGRYYRMVYTAVEDETTHIVSLAKPTCGSHVLTLQDIKNADVDRDVRVDSSDSSAILTFYSNNSTGQYADAENAMEAWRIFLRENIGINIVPDVTPEGVVEIFKYEYVKGIRVRYNELKGLSTSVEYLGDDTYDSETIKNNDRKNMLSIKIADPSAGMLSFDPLKFGGLRFGTAGYLGLRVNNNNDFSSVLPTKNQSFNFDVMNVGTRGLMIYGGSEDLNVVGVQLTTNGELDNGELCIDEKGCLRLSPNINFNLENLTITGQTEDGTPETVSYNGGEELIINLGPGLCFGSSEG